MSQGGNPYGLGPERQPISPIKYTPSTPANSVPLWQALLFPMLAGGLAWGIRGQYGHETGAMLAGLLVGLVFAILFFPKSPVEFSFRAIALFALGIGFGGSMTYGQTIGLTQNPQVIGNWEAWAWGMLGLAIKGGLWIGLGGIFLGMGLGGKRYKIAEMAGILSGLLLLFIVGIYFFNEPYDPPNKKLPFLYFSANWVWEPNSQLKPRREVWGGYLLGLVGLVIYTGIFRKDLMAPRMAYWGFIGGFLGFPLGQCLQSWHAWNLDTFQDGFWVQWDPVINWWNMMETTFGAIMGGLLGLGLWLNQKQIQTYPTSDHKNIPFAAEFALLGFHLFLLISFEFAPTPVVTWLYQYGIPMAALPLLAIASGRWSIYFQLLPILATPIAGKTLVELAFKNEYFSHYTGWIFVVGIPLGLTTLMAIWIAGRSSFNQPGCFELRFCLFSVTWMYFFLNFAFFRFPWLWQSWTPRTPNGLIYLICSVGLTVFAIMPISSREHKRDPTGPTSG